MTLSPEGTLLKNNSPYNGIGVNYFDCFLRTLRDGKDLTYQEGFVALKKYKIPFARFAATGYWPSEMQIYITNRTEYFRRLDAVVQSAASNQVGLIPSLFWYYACVPDLVNEHIDQWGNTNSRTHAFMRQYTHEVVSRYKDSPAIWAWEFGNEFNLSCDLPNARDHRPAVHPGLGTASLRTDQDDLSYAHLQVALRSFTQAVRRIDPDRVISAGNAMLRPHSWHNMHDNNWKDDNYAQQLEILGRANPSGVNLLSVHCYGQDWRRLDTVARAARDLKIPIFVGEFQIEDPDSEHASEAFEQRLSEIRRLKIPLAAIWVFDYAAHEKDFNVSSTNRRQWQLKMIGEWNSGNHTN
jgi:hypothetical protein